MLYLVLEGGLCSGQKVEPGLLSIRRLLSGMEEGRGQVSDKPLSPPPLSLAQVFNRGLPRGRGGGAIKKALSNKGAPHLSLDIFYLSC
jgi:hypothetical protein